MIWRFRYTVRNVEEKNPEWQQYDYSNLYLLRRRAEKNRQQENWRHQTRQDDVHDVEGVAPFHLQGEGHKGKPLVRSRVKEELITDHLRLMDLPLPVGLVAVHVDDVAGAAQVHLGGVVAPRPEHQCTSLLVKRVVRDVDLTHRLEHAARLPVDASWRVYYGSELSVVPVNPVSPGGKIK